MSSDTDKFKGKAKQAGGKATNNKELQAKGKAQETKGKLKSAGENLVEKVDDTIKKSD